MFVKGWSKQPGKCILPNAFLLEVNWELNAFPNKELFNFLESNLFICNHLANVIGVVVGIHDFAFIQIGSLFRVQFSLFRKKFIKYPPPKTPFRRKGGLQERVNFMVNINDWKNFMPALSSDGSRIGSFQFLYDLKRSYFPGFKPGSFLPAGISPCEYSIQTLIITWSFDWT